MEEKLGESKTNARELQPQAGAGQSEEEEGEFGGGDPFRRGHRSKIRDQTLVPKSTHTHSDRIPKYHFQTSQKQSNLVNLKRQRSNPIWLI